MFLIPLNKLRKTSTKLWCCARSCEGRYDYAVVTGKEVITNKPHVVLKSLRAAPQYGHQQMPFAFMIPQMMSEEGYEDVLQGVGES